jgi:NitT/TauT family transport system substrate-binding protein
MKFTLDRRQVLGLAAGALVTRKAWAQGGAPLEKLTLGAIPFTSSGAMFLALEKGWFREEGVDLTLRKFNTAGQISVAVVSGDLDLGVTGLTAAFYNMGGKGAIKMIAAQSFEHPGFEDLGYIVTKEAWESGVRTIPDIVGKRLGNTVIGSTIHYSWLLAAKKYDFDPAKVKMVQLQTLPNMAAAFKGGNLDAVIATANMYQQMQADKIGHLIAWVGDVTPWQLGALFGSPKVLKERRPAVVKFVRGYLRGCAAYNAAFNQLDAAGKKVKGPNYDEYLDILSKVVGQTHEQIALALPYIDAKGRLDVKDIGQQVSIWQEQGQLDKSLSAADFIDTSFVS